jgi:histidinol-phosphate aminotransferase
MNAPLWPRRHFTSSLAALVGATLAPRTTGAATTAGPDAPAARALVDLSSNENPYGPSPRALEAMTRCQSVACRYPDDVEKRVVEAIARLHGVDPERIVLGCGSSEVLRLCDAAFLGAGRKLVVAEPTFEAVLQYAKATKADPVKLPLDAAFRHDLEAMARACDATTGLVYLCNPNNPTGTIVRGDALEAFLGRVPASAVVLVDEAYHHFVEDPGYRSASELLDRFPNLVVARTFSKIYGMAGMRLGYGVTSKANAEALRAQASWGNTNVAVLEAALASLEDATIVATQRERLNGTRKSLCRALEADGRRYIPSQGNFLMIDVGGDVKPLIPAFEALGVKVGRRFDAMPGWLRVTIGKPDESEAFLRALRELVPARAAA